MSTNERAEVLNETVFDDLRAKLRAVKTVLDGYAPIAKRQRGCSEGCGCTDCEMVEDLYAVLDNKEEP